MTDIAAVRPRSAPAEAAQGAEPRSYWSTVAGGCARDRLTIAVGAVLLVDRRCSPFLRRGRRPTTRCRAAFCAG